MSQSLTCSALQAERRTYCRSSGVKRLLRFKWEFILRSLISCVSNIQPQIIKVKELGKIIQGSPWKRCDPEGRISFSKVSIFIYINAGITDEWEWAWHWYNPVASSKSFSISLIWSIHHQFPPKQIWDTDSSGESISGQGQQKASFLTSNVWSGICECSSGF